MASLGGRQHPSSPRPSASHTRLSLAGAAGHPRPRRGDRAGRLLPTATLRSQPGLPTVLAPCAGTTGQSLRSGDAGPVCGPRRAHRRARVRVSTWEPAGARGSCPCRPAHGWQRLPVGPFRGPRPSVVEASSSFSHVRVTCEDASLSLSRSSRLRCSRLRFSRHPSEPHLAPGDKRGLPRGPAWARRVSCTAAFPRTRLRPTSGGVTRARAPRTPVPSPTARAGRTARREHDGHPTKGRREDEPHFLKTFG